MSLHTLFGLLPQTLPVAKEDYALEVFTAMAAYTTLPGVIFLAIGIVLWAKKERSHMAACDTALRIQGFCKHNPGRPVIEQRHTQAWDKIRAINRDGLGLNVVMMAIGFIVMLSPFGAGIFIIEYYP